LGETLEISVFFGMAIFLLFPMASVSMTSRTKTIKPTAQRITMNGLYRHALLTKLEKSEFTFGQFTPRQGKYKTTAGEDNCRLLLLLRRIRRYLVRLLDSLSLSRHGESSSELSSVMILDPAFGNSLWKAKFVGQ
jgi:hypothetical protein